MARTSDDKIYHRAKAEIHRNAERVEQGLVNYIPFGLDRFEEYVPGVQRKNYTIVTANSGVGKSKLTKCLYVIRPVDFIMANRHLRLKLKIKYFCLEESKESFIQSIYCYKLYERFGLRVPIKMLKSVAKKALPREIRDKMDQLDGYFEEFEEYVEVIDDIKHGYGIYMNVVEFMEENGTWVKKNIPIWKKSADGKGGSMVITPVNDYYVPNYPDTYTEIITDHISKLHPPKGKDLREAIGDYSSIFCCDMRDKYKCSVINVQQQASDQEKKQYTYAGASIISKLEPSLDGLGENKTTQRDADEVIGIFAPARHEIPDHRGYKITKLDDNYRSLMQLKARDGHPNTRIGLYFDGAVNHFEELPLAKDMTDEKYEYYLQKCERSRGISQQTFNFGTP